MRAQRGRGRAAGRLLQGRERDEAGAVPGKVVDTLHTEAGASRKGSFGDTSVSNAWIVSSEDGETAGPLETAAATGSLGGFLEGVVTNLMTDGAGS